MFASVALVAHVLHFSYHDLMEMDVDGLELWVKEAKELIEIKED